MSLIERSDEIRDTKQVRGRSWSLVVAVAVIAMALAGIGIWVIDDGATSGTDQEIQQLLDDYLRAWETKDEAAVRSTVTEGFVINEYVYRNDDTQGFILDYHVNDDIDGVVRQGFGYAWTNEQVGDLRVTGEGPWIVSVRENWKEGSTRYEGQANYTVVEVDGALQIANHYWAGLRIFSTG